MSARFGSRPSTAIDVTVLPEPDSPTIPSTSLGDRSKSTPSTALTMPSSVRNDTRRSRTESSGAPVRAGGTAGLWRGAGGAGAVKGSGGGGGRRGGGGPRPGRLGGGPRRRGARPGRDE